MKKANIRIISLFIALMLLFTVVGCSVEGPTDAPTEASAPAEQASADAAANDAASPEAETSPDPAATTQPPAAESESSASQREFPDLKVKPNGDIKVGLLWHNADTENQSRFYQQAQIEAAHRGWEFIEGYWTPVDEARTNMQAFITQEVDAIVIGNMDIKAIADLIIQAREKGIGIYNVDAQLTEGVVSNACQPNGVAGAELAYKLGQDFMWEARYAIITNPVIQVQMERTDVAKAIFEQYPSMVRVGEEFVSGEGAAESRLQQGFNYAKRFFEMEGEELDIIFCSYDSLANACSEAAKQLPYKTDCAIIGIDGGSAAWGYIREEGSNFKYSYAQPTELYCHSSFELIDQLQVQGMKPGDPGCMLNYFGQTMYFTGYIVDKSNVPPVGVPIHAAFNYYGGDPQDPDAWYNWQEAGGPTMIK